ncbi:MAG: oxepin-CoA hydrolase, alternative type [Alphaproteobacteria bacterium]
MMETLILERKGRVLVATIDDPATRNALNWDFYDGFREVVEGAAADPEIGAIVLTGAAGFFSSGGNVHGLKERSEADYPTRRSSVERLHRMILAMRASPKPIVAAVDGGAAGAGASVAAACDLVVAARDAYFSVAYVKIGLTPDGGATAFFGAALPRQLLAEMVFTGDRIPVERLYALGMINRLTEPGQSLATALELAARLADGPAAALAVGKRLIDQARLNPLEAQLEAEAEGIAAAIGGPEGREGITAFLEKRKPDFRGLE